MKSIIHSIKTSNEEADRRSATADVANPRPRKVGGAYRLLRPRFRENLYPAGGPNEATRSEFRRDGLPAGTKIIGNYLYNCYLVEKT